ncbi:MAG: hypothetical protein ACXW3L_03325 [Limisphaerales bacterium]
MSEFPTRVFINGEFRRPATDKRQRLVNPSNDEPIAEISVGDVNE